MPGQAFQVLQCYSCRTFQVQQKKKVNKWVCKMCGEKQSIKKIYGEGSGSDCRVHVQKLNMLRGEMNVMHNNHPVIRDMDNRLSVHHSMSYEEITHQNASGSTPHYQNTSQSKSYWDQYIEDEGVGDDQEEREEDQSWTTDRQMYRTSLNRLKETNTKKKFQSAYRPYTLKRDEIKDYNHTNSAYFRGYRAGSEKETRENTDTSWYRNQTFHNNQTKVGTQDIISDIITSTPQPPDPRIPAQSKRGPCTIQKGILSSTVSACPMKDSKWSSFIDADEHDEDSEDDSENQDLRSAPGEVRYSGQRYSSLDTESLTAALESKRSVFETESSYEGHHHEISSRKQCSRKQSSNMSYNCDTPVHLKDCNSGTTLKESRIYTNTVSSAPSAEAGSMTLKRTSEYRNRSVTISANRTDECVPKRPIESIFSVGDIDEDDLNLDI